MWPGCTNRITEDGAAFERERVVVLAQGIPRTLEISHKIECFGSCEKTGIVVRSNVIKQAQVAISIFSLQMCACRKSQRLKARTALGMHPQKRGAFGTAWPLVQIGGVVVRVDRTHIHRDLARCVGAINERLDAPCPAGCNDFCNRKHESSGAGDVAEQDDLCARRAGSHHRVMDRICTGRGKGDRCLDDLGSRTRGGLGKGADAGGVFVVIDEHLIIGPELDIISDRGDCLSHIVQECDAFHIAVDKRGDGLAGFIEQVFGFEHKKPNRLAFHLVAVVLLNSQNLGRTCTIGTMVEKDDSRVKIPVFGMNSRRGEGLHDPSVADRFLPGS